jgi:hypothetical protein
MRFSLLGGPLHRLARRVGLVRGESNSIPLGLLLGFGTWAVLVALALVTRDGHRLFSMTLLAAHVGLLVALPLFFVCEAWVGPRMTVFVDTLTRSGVVPANSVAALESDVAWIRGCVASWLPDALCLVAAVLWARFGSSPAQHAASVEFDPRSAMDGMSLAGHWYVIVCAPMLRFLLLRWLWRLGLWSIFLWRVTRRELHLVPTHPDGVAGVGYLEVVHEHFLPLIFALSAVQAAGLAAEINAGVIPFDSIGPELGMILVVDLAVFLGPALLFAPKLWACRRNGLSEYMIFASGYVGGFEKKWLGADAPPEEPVLGTADLQSLADLGNSMGSVRNMRIAPISLTLLRDVTLAALLPMLPLLLLKYPLAELVRKFVSRLAGG